MCGWRSLPASEASFQQLAAVHGAELRVAEHLGLDRLQRTSLPVKVSRAR